MVKGFLTMVPSPFTGKRTVFDVGKIHAKYEGFSLLKDEWINKMWDIHTVVYYLVFTRKEVLTHATM